MALSGDLRKRVVEAVVVDGLSRNAAAKLFKVSIASAVRWVKQFETRGDVSPRPCGGDRRSGRIEVHHDYLMPDLNSDRGSGACKPLILRVWSRIFSKM